MLTAKHWGRKARAGTLWTTHGVRRVPGYTIVTHQKVAAENRLRAALRRRSRKEARR